MQSVFEHLERSRHHTTEDATDDPQAKKAIGYSVTLSATDREY